MDIAKIIPCKCSANVTIMSQFLGCQTSIQSPYIDMKDGKRLCIRLV